MSSNKELVNAIKQYTRYKVLDGISPVAVGEDVENPEMLLAAQAVARKPGGIAHAVSAIEWSPILYCYFRRWLTFEGAEAVAGACGGAARRARSAATQNGVPFHAESGH